jgi:hypothetical protein
MGRNGLKTNLLFHCKMFGETWFSTPNTITAPFDDINFLKKLVS